MLQANYDTRWDRVLKCFVLFSTIWVNQRGDTEWSSFMAEGQMFLFFFCYRSEGSSCAWMSPNLCWPRHHEYWWYSAAIHPIVQHLCTRKTLSESVPNSFRNYTLFFFFCPLFSSWSVIITSLLSSWTCTYYNHFNLLFVKSWRLNFVNCQCKFPPEMIKISQKFNFKKKFTSSCRINDHIIPF